MLKSGTDNGMVPFIVEEPGKCDQDRITDAGDAVLQVGPLGTHHQDSLREGRVASPWPLTIAGQQPASLTLLAATPESAAAEGGGSQPAQDYK